MVAPAVRRACDVPGADRTMVRYRSRRDDDKAIRERMRGQAAERRRFGYRRLHWLLEREGAVIHHKKFRRLYREERLRGAPSRPRVTQISGCYPAASARRGVDMGARAETSGTAAVTSR